MKSPLRPLTRRLATTYLGRCLVFGRPNSHDQARMPQCGLTPSPVPVALVQHALPGGLGSLPVSARAGALPVPLA
ncbi:MAG: hypothetical protein ACXWCO_11710, partial [Caldimonas sp.]